MALVFPPPMDDMSLLSVLQLIPKPFPEGWKDWVLSARLGLLEFITECHYVFEYDLDLANKMLAMARASFRARDPRDPRVIRAILQIAAGKMVSVPRFGCSGGGGGLGILVIGISGVGKSSGLDRVCKLLGAYGRIHLQLNGEPARWPQLGVIRLNVRETWKATLKDILTEANRQSGRDIHHAPARASVQELEQRVEAALSMGWAPVLVLDEIQRLANLTANVAKEILNGAINLMNGKGIPVVLVGTERVRQLFLLHKAELTKFANGGIRRYKPLEEFDEDTSNFIGFLRRYSVSLTPIGYPAEFDHVLWVHSMGVKRIMVEYMRCVLTRHAMDETTEVNTLLLQSIAEREMVEFEPALSVLRRAKLGQRIGFSEHQEYEDFLEEAFRNRSQTGAEIRVQALWRSFALQDDEQLMSAQDFLSLRDRLRDEEVADRHRRDSEPEVVDIDANARAGQKVGVDGTDASGTVRASLLSRKRSNAKSGLAKAKKQLKEVSNVVGIDTARRDRGGPEDGVAPSDVR